MTLRFYRTIQFLNGGDDKLVMGFTQLLNQVFSIGGTVYAAVFKGVKLISSLGVQIISIDDKHHFFDIRQLHDDLTGFKRGQRFTWACGVPDITIFIWIGRTFNQAFGCMDLIGS